MPTGQPSLAAQQLLGDNGLTQVLGHSERVTQAVEKCAEELSAVNDVIKERLIDRLHLPAVEGLLEKNEKIEGKVHACVEQLKLVNDALADEVRKRELLEHELAAVKLRKAAFRHAALHDPLTSLPNRALLEDRLHHGLAQARRHGRTFAVMFIDLDRFKSINDEYGHGMGDRVLQIVADRLKKVTRAEDTICRYGGDEFIYVLIDINGEEDMVVVAEKLLKAISRPCEVDLADGPATLTVTPSIGIAGFPADGNTAAALVKRADRAMYRAKQTMNGYSFDR